MVAELGRAATLGCAVTSPPRTRQRFDANPAAVGMARHFVHSLLDGDERAKDAALIVTELATNAVRHAGSPFTVTVTLDRQVRIEVTDASAELPTPRAAPPDAEGGRGLHIVEKVASTWGTRLEPEGGKAVWAELEAVATDRVRALSALRDAEIARLEVAEQLGVLLERVTKLLDADTAVVLLLDEGSRLLRATAARGVEGEVREGVCVPIGVGFAGHIAAARRPVALDRVDETTVVSPVLCKAGIASMLGVPLQSAWDLLGVLHVGRRSERRFDKVDVELLELIGRRVEAEIDLALLERRFLPSLAGLRGLAHAGGC